MGITSDQHRQKEAEYRAKKDEITHVERQIQSLGPDILPTLLLKEAEEQEKIEKGMGNFEHLNALQDRVAEAQGKEKERAGLWAKWKILRMQFAALEKELEQLRIDQGTHRKLTAGRVR